jgi:hypothetical protein
LARKGNEVAAAYLPILEGRLSQTGSQILMEVAYLLTETGLFEARGRLQQAYAVPILSSPEVAAEALQVKKAIDEICAKFVEVVAIFGT